MPEPEPKIEIKKFEFQSLWRQRHSRIWSFYCPQCRAPRRAPRHPNPASAGNIARIALCSAVFSLALWNQFGWKGLVSFVPFWAVFEIFYRSRMRGMLACPHCGFDPYLYLVDAKLARKEIEDHWKRKFAEHGIPFPAPKHGSVPTAQTEMPAPQRSVESAITQTEDGGSP